MYFKGTASRKLIPMLLYSRYIVGKLSVSIVRRPLKIICIKGPIYKLHLKFTALSANLPWKVHDFPQVSSLGCSLLGKLPILIESLLSFCCVLNFPSKIFDKLLPTISGCVLPALKVLCGEMERCRSFATCK